MSEQDKLTYDRDTGEYYDAYKRTRETAALKARKKALTKSLKKKEKDIDHEVLKGLHDKINKADTEKEALKIEKRLKKYQKMFREEKKK